MNLQAIDVIIGAVIAMTGTLATPLVMLRSERKIRRYDRMVDAYTEGQHRALEAIHSDLANRRHAYSLLLESSARIKVLGSKVGARKFVSITNLVAEFHDRTWDITTAALLSERAEDFAAQARHDVGTEPTRSVWARLRRRR